MDDISKSLREAAGWSQIIKDNVAEASVNARDFTQNMTDGMIEYNREAKKAFDSKFVNPISKAFGKLKKDLVLLTKQIANTNTTTLAWVGGLTGLKVGLTAAGMGITTFGGLVKTTFTFVGSIIRGLVGTFGLFFSFFYNALNGGGGDNGLFEQIQKLKEEFGALSDFTNQAVFGIARGLRELPRNLSGVGIYLKDVLENAAKYATTLGPLFVQFAERDFTPATEIFRAGLGLTEETFKQLVQDSRATGRRFNDVALDIARNAGAIGEAVGVSQKIIAREMMAARTNIKAFGDLTDEEIGLAVGRFQSLGLEVENVLGLFDKFNTFESAAEAASQVASAFGVQLDVYRLVNEENPAEALDEVRRAFARSGKSVEDFSRRELQLLTQQLGFSDERMTRLALSSENAGLSMEEIQQRAQASGEANKSLEEVLQDLIKAISLVRLQGQQFNSFLEAMNAGISLGINRFLRFNGILWRYRRALHVTYWGFARLTTAVLEALPGIDHLKDALRAAFDPELIRRNIYRLKDMLVDLVSSGGHSFEDFSVKVREMFHDLFGRGSPIVSNFIEGGKQILRTIGNILKNSIQFISEFIFKDDGIAESMLEGVLKALQFLSNALKRDNVEDALSSGGDFIANIGGGIFRPIVDFFRSSEGKQLVKDIFKELGKVLIEFAKTADSYFKDLTGILFDKLGLSFLVDAEGKGPGIMATLLGVIFAPTIVGAGIAVIGGFASRIVVGLAEAILNRSNTRILSNSISGLVSNSSQMAGRNTRRKGGILNFGNVLDDLDFSTSGASSRTVQNSRAAAASVASAGDIGRNTAGLGRISVSQIIAGGAVLVAVAAALAVGGYQLIKHLNDLEIRNPDELIKKATAFGIVTGAVGLTATAMAYIANVIGGQSVNVMIGGGILGTIGAALTLGMPALINSINSLDIGNFDEFMRKVGAVGIVLGGITATAALMAVVGGIAYGSGGVSIAVLAAGGAVLGAVGAALSVGLYAFLAGLAQIHIPESSLRIIEILPSFFQSLGPLFASLAGIAFVSATNANGLSDSINTFSEFLDKVRESFSNVVDTLDEKFSHLSESQISNIERGGNVFIGIFSALDPIFTALDMIISNSKAGLFRNQQRRTNAIREGLIHFSEFMNSILSRNSGLPAVIDSLGSMANNLTNVSVDKINAIMPIFELIGTMSAMAGTAATIVMEAARLGRGWFGNNATSEELVETVTDGINSFMSSMQPMLDSFPQLFDAMANSLSGINISESQANSISAISSLLQAMGALVSSLSESFQSERLRFLDSANGASLLDNWSGRMKVINSLSANIPDIASSMSILIVSIREPLGMLIDSLSNSLVDIVDTEGFVSKLNSVSRFFEVLPSLLEISTMLSERMGQTGEVFDNRKVKEVQASVGAVNIGLIQPMSTLINDVVTGLPEDNVINRALSKLESFENTGIIGKLEGFFESSGGLFEKIRSNSVISLGEQEIANVARILPAVAAAVETLNSPEIINDNLRIALNGTTFDITVILKVDAEELGRVAARTRLNP